MGYILRLDLNSGYAFTELFGAVHDTIPLGSDTHMKHNTLNSRLSGIMVGMEITINRKPG
jgi:hypothetical protein